jgi:hypothetical protein
MRKARTDKARLDAADLAYKDGEISVAGRIYMSLVRRRSPISGVATQRLKSLANEAQKRLKEIEAQLAKERTSFSPGELLSPTGPPAKWGEVVATAFQQYDRLADDYCWYRPAERQIETHVGKERRRAECAVVLKEPEAKALWETGQEHEADDHLCCAYWVYEKAARLMPAPSARVAQERLAELKKDPKIIASAEACRQLQQCHDLYNRAERVIKGNPPRAKELFEKILAQAPEDSEVYRAAQKHVRELN